MSSVEPRGTSLLRIAGAVPAFFALVCATSEARATPSFPDVLAAHVGTSAAPGCDVCHQGATQRGTVTTALGTSLRARGLSAYDEASLRTALDALEAERRDSDGDGVADVDELREGRDPNAAREGDSEAEVPSYGCSSSSAADGTFEGVALVFCLVMGVFCRRRALRCRGPSTRAIERRRGDGEAGQRSVPRTDW